MNKYFYHVIMVLFFSTLNSSLLSGAEKENDGIVIIEQVEYVSFHDPGVIKMKGNSAEIYEGSFYYSLISYEEINSWKSGEKFYIVYSHQNGSGIQRVSDEKFYKVKFHSEKADPIHSLEEKCLKQNMTTVGMSACLQISGEMLKKEREFFFDFVCNKSPEELQKKLKENQKLWEDFSSHLRETFSLYGDEMGGTIRTLNAATFYRDLQKSRLGEILNFLD